MDKDLLTNIIQMQGQLKILHWQTESYAEHKAFDKIGESLSDKFDRLIEVYSGKNKRPEFKGMKQITFADYSNLKLDAFLDSFLDFMNDSFMAQQDGELNNIKEEIIADVQQLKYLLTFK